MNTVTGGLVLLVVTVPAWAGMTPSGPRQTVYRFAKPALLVPASLLAGTVMATTLIPERASPVRGTAVRDEVLWVDGRRPGRQVTVATNLAGVALRMTLERAAVDSTSAPLSGRWNDWPAPPVLTRSGIRVELVKTGPMRAGTVSRIPDVHYRLLAGHPAAVVETLHYDGHLSIGLAGATPGKPGRLS